MFMDLRAFIISLLIGLMIGSERESSHPEGHKAMGVRTFMLIALLGTTAAHMEQQIFSISIAFFTLSAILLGYLSAVKFQQKATDIGLTTELSAGFVFYLGYLSKQQPLLALLLSSVVLLILSGRKHIHHFTRNQLRPNEVQATGVIILVFLVAVLLLPDRTIDPWQLFNPHYLGIIIALVSGMQFAGYLVIRIFGNSLGTALMGFFGGLVSSTAVFATLPKLAKKNSGDLSPILVSGLLATISMFLKLAVLLLFISPALFKITIVPIASSVLSGTIIILIIRRHNPAQTNTAIITNPLDFKSIIYLSLVICAIFITTSFVKHHFSIEVLKYVSLLAGMVELHSTAAVSATLFATGKLSLASAQSNILAAILGTYLSKFVLLFSSNHQRFTYLCICCLLLMMGGGLLGVWGTGYL